MGWNYKKLINEWDKQYINFIKCNINKINNFSYISQNKSLTLNFIKEHIEYNWNWYTLSRILKLKIEDILNNYDLDWKFKYLTLNESFYIEDFIKYYYLPWDWSILIMNNNITMQIIEDNFYLNWDYTFIIYNKNFNINELYKYDKLKDIFYKKNIFNNTYDFYLNDIKEKKKNIINIDYYYIFKINNNIINNIKYNNYIHWDSLSLNNNLTFENINYYKDKPWNWDLLLSNEMKNGKILWINNLRIKIIKTLRIQRFWRYYSSNPKYKLARKIIMNYIED